MFGGTFICTAASRPASSNLPLTSNKSFWIINFIEYLTKKKNLKKSKHQKIAWVPSYSKSDVNLQWRQCSNSDHFLLIFNHSRYFQSPNCQVSSSICHLCSSRRRSADLSQCLIECRRKSPIQNKICFYLNPVTGSNIRQVSQKWICVQGLCKNVPKIQSQHKDYPIFRPLTPQNEHFLETSSRLISFNCFELVPS